MYLYIYRLVSVNPTIVFTVQLPVRHLFSFATSEVHSNDGILLEDPGYPVFLVASNNQDMPFIIASIECTALVENHNKCLRVNSVQKLD